MSQDDGNLIRHHLIWLEFLHDIKRSLCESHASKYDTISVNNDYVEKKKNLEAFFILTKRAII